MTVILSSPAASARRVADRPTVRRRGSLARRTRSAYLLALMPAVVYLVVFYAYPLVYGVYMGFTDYSTRSFITGEAAFVGFDNYANVLSSPLFLQALRNTVVITVAAVSAQIVGGLLIALYFSRRFPGSGWMQSVTLVSWLLPLVITATIWRWLLQGNGAVNSLLGTVGIPGPNWLTDPSTALWAIIGVDVWSGMPFAATILAASIRNFPPELNEAALLDGAGYWRRVWSIMLPSLRPVIAVLFVLGIVSTLKLLDLVLVLTDGGPANSTQTIALQSYVLSFRQFDFGAGAAIGNLLLVLAAVFAIVYAHTTKKEHRA